MCNMGMNAFRPMPSGPRPPQVNQASDKPHDLWPLTARQPIVLARANRGCAVLGILPRARWPQPSHTGLYPQSGGRIGPDIPQAKLAKVGGHGVQG
jgi:hypothetical protein